MTLINKHKKFIYGLIAGIFFFSWWLTRGPRTITNTPQPTVNVTEEAIPVKLVKVVIDFGESRAVSSDVQAATVFSALQEAAQKNNLQLQTKVYDFGTLVEKIGDYENTADKVWIYYVNGESGQIAADQMELKAGDLVEWKYVTPN